MPYEFDGPNDLYGVFNEEKSVYIGDPFTRDAYRESPSPQHRLSHPPYSRRRFPPSSASTRSSTEQAAPQDHQRGRVYQSAESQCIAADQCSRLASFLAQSFRGIKARALACPSSLRARARMP